MTANPVQIGNATLYQESPVMMSGVVGPRHDFEVFNSVVGFVAVFVMNNLVRAQRPANVGLHHNTMLAAASVLAVLLRCQRNVAVGVVRLPAPKVPMSIATTADCLALKASTALCSAFSERPTFNRLGGRAIADTVPVMKLASFTGITSHSQAAKSLTCKVRNAVPSPIACGGF